MKHPGMGCAFWALVFWVPGSLLMILGMQTALEMVKPILKGVFG